MALKNLKGSSSLEDRQNQLKISTLGPIKNPYRLLPLSAKSISMDTTFKEVFNVHLILRSTLALFCFSLQCWQSFFSTTSPHVWLLLSGENNYLCINDFYDPVRASGGVGPWTSCLFWAFKWLWAKRVPFCNVSAPIKTLMHGAVKIIG